MRKTRVKSYLMKTIACILVAVLLMNHLPYAQSYAAVGDVTNASSTTQDVPVDAGTGSTGTDSQDPNSQVTMITVTGKVTDADGGVGKNVELVFTDSQDASNVTKITTDASGEYQTDLAQDQTYDVFVESYNTTKYENYEGQFTPTSGDTVFNLELQYKEYTVKFKSDGNGFVNRTDSHVTETVAYGYNYDRIDISAKDGYVIDTITELQLDQDGNVITTKEYPDKKHSQNTDISIASVECNYEIAVTFIPVYTITFDTDKKANVTSPIGSSDIITTVTNVEGTQVDFRVTPNEHYEIVKTEKIDTKGTETVLKGVDAGDSSKSIDYTITLDQEYEVKVTMKRVQHDVSAKVWKNGTLKVSSVENDVEESSVEVRDTSFWGNSTTETIQASGGNKIVIAITPDTKYTIDSLTVGGGNVALSNLEYDENQGSYLYEIDNLSAGTTIEVKFVSGESVEDKDQVYSYVDIKYDNGEALKIDNTNNAETRWINKDSGAYLQTKSSTNSIRVYYTDGSYSNKFATSGKVYLEVGKKVDYVEVIPRKGSKTVILLFTNINLILEDEEPQLNGIKKDPDTEWTNQDITITGTAVDVGEAGIYQVRYSYDQSKYNLDSYENVEGTIIGTSNGAFTVNIPNTQEMNSPIYIWSYDQCGNKSAYTQVNIKIDTTRPAFESIENKSADKVSNQSVTITGQFTDKVDADKVIQDPDILKGPEESYELTSNSKASSNMDKIFYSTSLSDIGSIPADSQTSGSITKEELNDADRVSNQFSFEIPAENQNNTYYVWGIDRAGNVSYNYQTVEVQIDTVEPIINKAEIITSGSKNDWYQSKVEIQVQAEDPIQDTINSGIDTIFYSTKKLSNPAEFANADVTFIDNISADGTGVFEAPIENGVTVGFDGTYYIYAVDKAGNVTSEPKEVEVQVDIIDPIITNFEQEENYPNLFQKTLNFLSFGAFFNEETEVKVKIEDRGISSGLDTVILYSYQGELSEAIANKELSELGKVAYDELKEEIRTDGTIDKVAIFKLAPEFKGNIAAEVTDKSGRSTGVLSPDALPELLIEDNKPIVTLETSEEPYIQENADGTKTVYHSKDIELKVTATDVQENKEKLVSGIAKIQVTVNGIILADENYQNQLTEHAVVTIDTSNVMPMDGNKYECEVIVWDNANNKADVPVYTFIKDDIMPAVTNIEFSNLTEGNDSKLYTEDEQVNRYGYFVNKETKVTITMDDQAPSSGIKSLQYKVRDCSNGVRGEESSIQSVSVNENKAEIVLSPDFKGELYIQAVDNVGHQSGFVHTERIVVEEDTKHSETSFLSLSIPDSETKWNGSNLYNTDIDVNVVVSDSYSGIEKVEWSVISPYDQSNNQENKVVIVPMNHNGETEIEGWKIDSVEENLVTQMSHSIRVSNNSNDIVARAILTDRAGNVTTEEISFSIDKTRPTIQVMYDNNIEHHSGYYKESRIATVTINERNFNEGDVQATIRNLTNTASIPVMSEWTAQINDQNPDANIYTATVVFEAEGDYEFAVDYVDMAGNPAVSNVQQSFTIDKTEPTIGMEVGESKFTDSKGQMWYSQDMAMGITVKDACAGIYSVEVSINGTAVTTDTKNKKIDAAFYQNRTWEEAFYVNTNQVSQADDGSYTIEIKVVDNSGNSLVFTKKIFIDKAAPKITGFEFSTAGNIESDEKAVEILEYGYFFKKETKVTITANDPGISGGVNNITYYTVDYSKDSKGVTSGEVTKTVDGKNQITLTIPANFKGQIHAKATDNVGHTPTSFVNPAGTVVENAKLHEKTSAIVFDRPSTERKDNQNLDLYSSDTKVKVAVEDTYSGIRMIEWKVTADYDSENNQSGSITIDIDGNIEKSASGWKIAGTDQNLVTKMTKTITVKNNSNNIKVWIKFTDRAGNTSEKEIVFSIDKTVPEITVDFDNNSYDSSFGNDSRYFKDKRTATITVRERNFNQDNMKVTMSNTDGSVPAIGSWKEVRDKQNPDASTYTATVTFQQDGDYTMYVEGMDLAGNKANSVTVDPFTIDLVQPEISISYDNMEAKNNNYYSEARTATITIKEHNFETSRIQLDSSVSESKSNKVPTISNWTSNGDVHTASITFDEDGLYSFAMNYTDKAGNEATPLEQQTFYIDLLAPTLQIDGIANHTANAGRNEQNETENVGFIITSTDQNFDTINAHLNLITVDGETNCDDLLGTAAVIDQGRKYTVENLDADGIYVLSCEVVDKAGNVTTKAVAKDAAGEKIETEEMMFSVNRNGSVYSLGDDTAKINGAYTNQNIDVVIVETNVNKLTESKLTLYNDGSTSVLEEGVDYQVEHTGGENEWSQYTYKIAKSNFEQDGAYSIALYSVDEASNISENTMESKKVEINFAIDKTKPDVIVTNLNDSTTYSEENKSVTMVVSDNLKLDTVSVYHTTYSGNGENISYGEAAETWDSTRINELIAKNEDFQFTIPGDSTDKHSIKVVAKDAAGCENIIEIKDFYVTTNWWINIKTNAIVFYSLIAGIVAVVGGIGVFVARKRKKQKVN